MIPTGLQDKVNLPLVGLTLLRLPTPHLEPCLHLADFFFFLTWARKKKTRTKKVKHITYSALSCCFQKPTCLQEPLFWDTWKFSMFGYSEQRRFLFLGPAFYWSPFQGSVLGSFLDSLKERWWTPLLCRNVCHPLLAGWLVCCRALCRVWEMWWWTIHAHSLPSWSLLLWWRKTISK